MLLTEADSQLQWGKYSPIYRHRLLEGAAKLREHLVENGWEWKDLRSVKARKIDQLLVDFVHRMHKSGEKSSLRVAKHAVLFTQAWRPRLRKALPCTWQALRSWEELKPSKFRAPLPLPLLAVLTCASRHMAFFECEAQQRDLWLTFSTLLLVGFYALLRPGELLKLSAADITLPNSFSMGCPFAVVRIRSPKNSRQMGSQQFAEVRHPDAVNWLVWLVGKRKEPAELLWKSSQNRFRMMFRRLTQKLQIEHLKLSPASLRAGGATWMLDEKIEVSKIRFSGRWANLRSLEHYLQVARAQQIAIALPMEVADILKQVLLKFGYMLCLPQFLAAQVPSHQLVASHVVDFSNASRATERVRAWGRIAETVQASRDHWGPAPWCQVP